MPIDSQHIEYQMRHPSWLKCQDFYEGMDTVKRRGEVYLPRLSNQSDAKYDLYRFRAGFFGATSRTIDGMVGAVIRKTPQVSIPEALSYLYDKATIDGLTLFEAIKLSLKELMLIGRFGLLVDVDSIESSQPTPYIVIYTAFDIVNWGDNFYVLRESNYEPDPVDPYVTVEVIQYRELFLDEGVYKVRVHRSAPAVGTSSNVIGTDAGLVWEVTETTPTVRGVPLDYIPFTVANVNGLTSSTCKPVMMDLVDENHSHYMSYADIEWGRHWVAIPTPYATGIINDPNNPIVLEIGGESAWILPEANCKAGFLEFTGQGLGALETALAEKESRMSALGARLIEPRRTQVETAESARVRQSGEASVIVSVISHIEAAFGRCLETMTHWVGSNHTASIQLNRELLETKLMANDVVALLNAVQSGRLSHETFFNILEDASYMRPGDSFESELEKIRSQFVVEGIPAPVVKEAATPPVVKNG